MPNHLRRVEKVNITFILAYGAMMIITMFHLPFGKVLFMLLNLIVGLAILFFMDHLMKHEPIVHRSSLYYYAFLFFVTITIYIDGAFNSDLFPGLFIIPILYISVNFPRKGSTGVGIFAVSIIWLTLMQDPALLKLNQSVLVSLTILVIPQIIGLLVKKYVNNMKNLVKISRPEQ